MMVFSLLSSEDRYKKRLLLNKMIFLRLHLAVTIRRFMCNNFKWIADKSNSLRDNQ